MIVFINKWRKIYNSRPAYRSHADAQGWIRMPSDGRGGRCAAHTPVCIISRRKNGWPFFECFPIGLSRACLGKMSIFSDKRGERKRPVFFSDLRLARVKILAGGVQGVELLRRVPDAENVNAAFSPQRFLCLFRACLGKTIVFIIKWRPKKAFSAAVHTRVTERSVRRRVWRRFPPSLLPVRRWSDSHSFFECFPYVCPEPVLAKRSS